jgi:hypothetical protein
MVGMALSGAEVPAYLCFGFPFFEFVGDGL